MDAPEQPLASIVYELTDEMAATAAAATQRAGGNRSPAWISVLLWLLIFVVAIVTSSSLLGADQGVSQMLIGLVLGFAGTLVLVLAVAFSMTRKNTVEALEGLPSRTWSVLVYRTGVAWTSPLSSSSAPWSSFEMLVEAKGMILLKFRGKGSPCLLLPESQLTPELRAWLRTILPSPSQAAKHR